MRINLPGISDPELLRGFREDAQDIAKGTEKTFTALREAARARGI